jgi:hypothetical protein
MKKFFSFFKSERNIALLAFGLSLLSLGTQFYHRVSGYDVKLHTPEKILIHSEKYQDEWKFVTISAVMTSLNTGHHKYPRFNDVIKSEMVNMEIRNKNYDFKWNEFVSPRIEGTILNMNRKENAIPFLLKAGEVKTHETHFSPSTEEKNWLKWSEFLETVSKVDEVLFTFSVESYGGKKDEITCKVLVDKGFREYCEKREYYYAQCT